MTSLFKPKVPKPPEPPPVPNRTDEQVQAAADEQRRLLAQKTRSQSWLTGGLGVPRSSGSYGGMASRMLGGGG